MRFDDEAAVLLLRIWRAALSAYGINTGLTLLYGDGFPFHCLFHQTLGLLAHRLF
ncbi:MAG: hypothetical protein WA728_13175 [Xanthobacteraceae bacterium]